MPRLKGNDFLKPYFPALVMDMILFGPGVNAVRKTYEKKAAKFMINTSCDNTNYVLQLPSSFGILSLKVSSFKLNISNIEFNIFE